MPSRPPLHVPPQGTRAKAQQVYNRLRGNSAQLGYDHAWRKVRLAYLKANPLCADCMSRGEVTAADEVHHIVKIAAAPQRRLDPSNFMALCMSCHSIRTRRGE